MNMLLQDAARETVMRMCNLNITASGGWSQVHDLLTVGTNKKPN